MKIYVHIYIYDSNLKLGQSWLKGQTFRMTPCTCVHVSMCVHGSIAVPAVSSTSLRLSQSNRRWWWWRWCPKAFNSKQWYISWVFWTRFVLTGNGATNPTSPTETTMWETEEHWQSETPSDDGGVTNKAWIKWTEQCCRWSCINLSKCLGLIRV